MSSAAYAEIAWYLDRIWWYAVIGAIAAVVQIACLCAARWWR